MGASYRKWVAAVTCWEPKTRVDMHVCDWDSCMNWVLAAPCREAGCRSLLLAAACRCMAYLRLGSLVTIHPSRPHSYPCFPSLSDVRGGVASSSLSFLSFPFRGAGTAEPPTDGWRTARKGKRGNEPMAWLSRANTLDNSPSGPVPRRPDVLTRNGMGG